MEDNNILETKIPEPKFKATRTTITQKKKDIIITRQHNKCANTPYNPAINLFDYKCPFWIYNYGNFDKSGYDIDHIEEFSITQNNELENLQALCHNCHAVKTKKFMKCKARFSSYDIYCGAKPMEIDKPIVKKRKVYE